MDVLKAIEERASTRAFLDKPVSRSTLEQLFNTARWAPSGVNTQPWQVVVVGRSDIVPLGDAIIAAREAQVPENPDYHYYPQQWPDIYRDRRRACGKALYGALNIAMDETDKRKAAWYRNYHFFGAPVGAFFCVDAALEKGSWVDMGMFIQSTMLAARGLGLETCAQAAMAEYPDIVREHLDLPSHWHIVCGMAIGYADPQAPVNQYRTEREPLDRFVVWKD